MPHRILIVDDEESIRSVLTDYLESHGYDVSTAADGEAALRVLRDDRPSVVVIDFLIPKKNGFALAEAIRSDPKFKKLPIIMMSGVFKNPKTAVEAREKYQVVDFLAKPFEMDTLHAVIKKAIANGVASAPPPPRGQSELDLPDMDESDGDMEDRVSRAVFESAEDDDGRPSRGSSRSAEDSDLELEPIASFPDSGGAPAQPRSSVPPRGLSYGMKSGSSMPAPSASMPAPAPKKAPARQASVFTGRPFPEMADEGSLDQFPVALLISTARYDGLTGMLDLADSGTHRRLYMLQGRPIFMQSNAEGENVGALLLRRGRITEPDFERCLQYMKGKKRTLQQALLDLRLATETDLSTAYKLLAGQLLPGAIGMPTGTFKWRETDAFVGRVPEGNFDSVSVLFEGIKRHVHPPQILRFFKGREDVALLKTAEFDQLAPSFRRAFSANNVISMIDGRATYRDITRSRGNDTATIVPQLFALVTSGMTMLPEITEDNAMDVAVNQAAASVAGLGNQDLAFDDDAKLELDEGPRGGGSMPAPSGRASGDGFLSPEDKAARRKIEEGHATFAAKNFFEIMQADPDNVDAEKVKATYLKLAKQWHSDAYAGLDLGEAETKLDATFKRITEAYETLVSPSKLGEYRVFLDRQKKGLPTDMNQIFQAEQLFDSAIAALKKRDLSTAKAQLKQAAEMNPGEALFWAHLGWVTYLLAPNSQAAAAEAQNQIKKGVAMQENLPIAYQFLGQIAYQKGAFAEAKRWWQKCVEFEPNNIEATRGIRLINQRDEKEKSSKSGLLSKFLSKK